jgi:CheY-like chemotaxis protein
VRFLWEGEAEDGSRVHFSVTDTGVGIPEDRMEAIFESFTQADDSITRDFGGTGLGLTISQQLVQLMGGGLTVSSKLNFGSTFEFMLTLAHDDIATNQQVEPVTSMDLCYVGAESPPQELQRYARERRLQLIAAPDIRQIQRMVASSSTLGHARVYLVDVRTADRLSPRLAETLSTAHRDRRIPVIGLGAAPNDPHLSLSGYTSLMRSFHRKEFERAASLFANQASRRKQESDGEEFDRLTILVADDNATNREVASMVLVAAGHDAVTAEDGQEAAKLLTTRKFDLAILDHRMPHKTGLEVVLELRALEPAYRHLPVILLSADAASDFSTMPGGDYIDRFLTKPIQPQKLLQAVRELVAAERELLPPVRHSAGNRERPLLPQNLRLPSHLPDLDPGRLVELQRNSLHGRYSLNAAVRSLVSGFENRCQGIEDALQQGDQRGACDRVADLADAAASLGLVRCYQMLHAAALHSERDQPEQVRAVLNHLKLEEWPAARQALHQRAGELSRAWH